MVKTVKKVLYEVLGELKLVLLGKSMDILLPPAVFLILNGVFDLLVALVGSLILALIFLMIRIYKKDNLLYSISGFIAVLFAIIMSLLSENGSNFFIPDIIGTVTLIIATVISLIIKKPIAMFVSHITRGWELEWFYRKDVLPAYKEVSIFWLFFFVGRLSIELYLYFNSTVEELAVANIILGFPLLIGVLTISYIYGITRLHKLKGPGIDEFREGKEPPYRGQYKGF